MGDITRKPFPSGDLEALCKVLADTNNGLTGSEIAHTLAQIAFANTKGRCFKRVDSSNRIMRAQEIAHMHLHSTGLSWDKYPVQNASLEDIDIERIKRYIQKAKETGRKKIGDDEDSVQVLEKMNLIIKGQPTWAAILIFCKEPQKIISQAAVHCGRFKDGDIVGRYYRERHSIHSKTPKTPQRRNIDAKDARTLMNL